MNVFPLQVFLSMLTVINWYEPNLVAEDGATKGQSATDLEASDDESCVDYILDYILSDTLISSENEGVSHLLILNDSP